MGIAAALQVISQTYNRWNSTSGAASWIGGFITAAGVARRAPADLPELVQEINRLTAHRHDTSPEVYENGIQGEIDPIVDALLSGRVAATPEQSTAASISRQGALIIELAEAVAQKSITREPDDSQYRYEVELKMGTYMAGLILGLRLGRAHSDTGAEALVGAALDYMYREEGGIKPALRLFLEKTEQETVRRIVSGEGFD